jgi:large repetitive protein
VLGPENQDPVLDTLEAAVGGGLLGATVRGVVEGLLGTLGTFQVGGLILALQPLLPTALLDSVLDTLSDTLLSNTLTLLQTTTLSTTLTEYDFAEDTVTGNVILGDAFGAGADDIIPGTLVSEVSNADGDTIAVPDGGTATLAGRYGQIELYSDGSYTYTANGVRRSIGQDDVFTYTVSDGHSTNAATLTVALDGDRISAVDDVATAGVSFDNV